MRGEIESIGAQWYAFDMAMHASNLWRRCNRVWNRPVVVKMGESVAQGTEPDWNGEPLVIELPAFARTFDSIERARRYSNAELFLALGFD